MLPKGFKVRNVDRTTYELEGKVHTHVPGLGRMNCQVLCHHNAKESFEVFVQANPRRVPWLPILETKGRWLKVDIGEEPLTPLEAVAKAEAVITGLPPRPQPPRPEELPKVVTKAQEDEKPELDRLRYRWDGKLLLEVADYVDWSREGLEQICYISGLMINGYYVPLEYHKVKGRRTAASVQVDAVSKSDVLQQMEEHHRHFLGSVHSQPDGITTPSSVDKQSMSGFQSHYPCFGCVIVPSGRVEFYGSTKPVQVEIDHPDIEEVEDGRIFQLKRPK